MLTMIIMKNNFSKKIIFICDTDEQKLINWYRDFEFFKLKLFYLHIKKYALIV